jgi:hypothetical protein
MNTNRFKKYEAFVAGCFLASNIDGDYSPEEHRLIYDKVMLNGEKLVIKVDHAEYFRKWNTFKDKGGLGRIESEIINTLKSCPNEFCKKVVAYMVNITYAAKNRNNGRWQDENEEALINRFLEKLHLDRDEIKSLRHEIY